MKEQPIVAAKRIRLAVTAKWIQRGTRANDADGRNGLHLIGGRLRIGNEPMHGGLYFSLPYDFPGVVDAKN